MKSEIRWYSILLVGSVLLLAGSVTGCATSYTEEDVDAAREVGYNAGFTEGYAAGKTAGYAEGYTKGKVVGQIQRDLRDLSEIRGPASTPLQTPIKSDLKVHFIDVGQGDSILLDLGATEILIDGGDKSSGVVEYLSGFVDGPLEVMLATHTHADHIGGLIGVLDAFEVDEIWHNGDTHTTQTYSELMSAVNSEDAKVYEARRGDTIEVGELAFNVHHPVSLDDTINNNSIVLSLSYGEIDFLFMGDAEQEAEASMLAEGIVPDVEILKVGHHGSKSSSSASFLDAVKPEVAIYMAGEGNSYGHPHQQTITTLAEVGANIYGTDIHGTIIITTDGEQYSLQLEIPDAPPVVSPTPAKFAVSNLSISPDDVEPGRTVTVSATITNSGGSSGSYTAILKINGSQVETKSVTLNEGESQVVSFSVVKASTGNYAVELGGLAGIFTVTKAVAPPGTDTVYITRTGAKYHRGSCRYLSQSKIAIERQEAISRGYTPCSVCRP
ncbi:MBL fold metallo-hydrolase [Chloroflexota bacterium]